MTRLSALLLCACLAGGCVIKGGGRGGTRLGLGIQQDFSQQQRDPDPTRPLGEDTAAPMLDPSGPVPLSPKLEAVLANVAAVFAWAATGKLPLIELSGTFDEVEIAEKVRRWFKK